MAGTDPHRRRERSRNSGCKRNPATAVPPHLACQSALPRSSLLRGCSTPSFLAVPPQAACSPQASAGLTRDAQGPAKGAAAALAARELSADAGLPILSPV